MRRYYAVSLDLRDQHCLVVGGGGVAERKVLSLVECGARVLVVAPEATARLMGLARDGTIRLEQRLFEPADLEGVALVIGATDVPEVNARVSEEAQRRRLSVNIVDQPELCSFIVPATCDFGPVTISISTSGTSPALARWLRERLEREFDPWLGELAELLGEAREEIKRRFPGEEDRRAVWQALLESDAPTLLREGRREDARERIRACISSPSG